jgi:clan AA aspartic protease (TIGR02281 family)
VVRRIFSESGVAVCTFAFMLDTLAQTPAGWIYRSGGRMTRSSVHLGLVFVITGVMMVAQSASALMYECRDPSGRSVFTDNPAQGDECAAVHKGTPPAPISPVPPVPSPVVPREQAEAVAADAATETPADITVPVFRVGHSLVVQARLNGTRDAKLIVDTGANITILSNQVARDAGILPSSYLSPVTLNTAGGPVRADVARLDALAVGAAEVAKVPVAIHDLPDAPTGVDGLLGLTFLDRFLVTLDTQKGELHLRRRE